MDCPKAQRERERENITKEDSAEISPISLSFFVQLSSLLLIKTSLTASLRNFVHGVTVFMVAEIKAEFMFTCGWMSRQIIFYAICQGSASSTSDNIDRSALKEEIGVT